MTYILNDEIFKQVDIDRIYRTNGLGGLNTSTFSTLNGINSMGGFPPTPKNSDQNGIVFFTRPDMNLSFDNVIGVRKLAYLASKDTETMASAIRCMLNPPGKDKRGDRHRSVLIDDRCAFIPMLTNTLLSLSGFPDLAPRSFTSKAGINGEEVIWMDDRSGQYNNYQLTANFTNMEGDPLTTLFETWIDYAVRVSEGSLVPFMTNIIENRIDYMTRPYRFLLDSTGMFIQKAWACGAMYPITVPTGAAANYNNDKTMSAESNEVTITFNAVGMIVNDSILFKEFNEVVSMFNPYMRKDKRRKEMVKLGGDNRFVDNEQALFNYKSYPYVSSGNELEWWVSKEDYFNMKEFIESN